MLVRGNISSFKDGVSKQADKLMYKTNLKQLKNAIPSLLWGTIKRPPMQHIAKLTSILSKHPLIHTVVKENEKYCIVLDGSTLRIFDLEGNEKTVNSYITEDFSYIETNDPLKDLYATTINDYTFILNRKKIPVMDSSIKNSSYNSVALVFVEKGTYETTYKITINGTHTAQYISASLTADVEVTPITIASNLETNLKQLLGETDWKINRMGAVIAITKKDGTAFTIETSDTNANTDIITLYKTTSTFTSLPTTAPNGFIIKISGYEADSSDDYFVEFKTKDDIEFGEGYWEECSDPTLPYKIDASTMPHILVREEDGSFTFKEGVWGERYAGDEESAPSPSFINNKIEKISTHKGRLVILSNGNFLASSTSDIFSFFKTTVRENLDSDPIDITSNVGMTELKHCLPYNGELLAFSELACFTISGGNVFSNSTISCDLTMQYDCSSKCEPISSRKGGFFVFENGQYSGVRDIYIDSTYNINAKDITEQVPCFLPKNIYKIIGSTVNNMALFLSTDVLNKIYVYSYYLDARDETKQAAWHEWEFENAKIRGGYFNQNILYLYIEYSDGLYLNKMDFTPKLKDFDLDFQLYIDRKVYYKDLTSNDNMTTLTLPYINDNNVQVYDEKGFPVEFSISGVTITVSGNYEKLIVGSPYETLMELPVLYYRQRIYGTEYMVDGLLMVKDITIGYNNTAYFKVAVIPAYPSMKPSFYTFTSSITGQVYTDIIKLLNGTFVFPVRCKNEEVTVKIINDSHLPSEILGLDWIGEFTRRGE